MASIKTLTFILIIATCMIVHCQAGTPPCSREGEVCLRVSPIAIIPVSNPCCAGFHCPDDRGLPAYCVKN